MPNEQTTVPLFVAAEVLTAADMNLSAGTGVPVFANTTTRDAGFGGAGEKVLAEGQLCYLSSTNVVQYYDGAAWATVGPAASGALTCVKAQTTQSGATRVELDNIFSATYRNYMIICEFSAANQTMSLQMNASGTPVTTATYNYQFIQANNTTLSAGRTAAASSGLINANNTTKSYVVLTIFAPFIAQATAYRADTYYDPNDLASPTIQNRIGNQTGSTSFTGIDIISADVFDSTITCYGYGITL